MDEIERPDGISRRRMLKRVGAGAAIAWAAPVLTSLRMPAFAAISQPECSGCSCDFFGNPSGCNGNVDCFCDQRIDAEGGGCFCDNDTQVGVGVGCTSSAQCPGGACVKLDCQGGTVCLGACGSIAQQGATRMRG